MITFKQTIADMRVDIARRAALEGAALTLFELLPVIVKKGVVAVILYRLSRYCVARRWPVIPKLLTLLEHFYTRNEISPHAILGAGLVIGDGGGIGITQVTVAGSNCTFLGRNSLTLGAMEDFDVSRDRIVLGDHCVIGMGVRVMRPVSLPAGTQVKPNSVVIAASDRPGSILSGIPAKRRGSASYEQVMLWNPLYGGYIGASK